MFRSLSDPRLRKLGGSFLDVLAQAAWVLLDVFVLFALGCLVGSLLLALYVSFGLVAVQFVFWFVFFLLAARLVRSVINTLRKVVKS